MSCTTIPFDKEVTSVPHADEATHATSADSATNATSADHATSADSATTATSANYANSAGKALELDWSSAIGSSGLQLVEVTDTYNITAALGGGVPADTSNQIDVHDFQQDVMPIAIAGFYPGNNAALTVQECYLNSNLLNYTITNSSTSAQNNMTFKALLLCVYIGE